MCVADSHTALPADLPNLAPVDVVRRGRVRPWMSDDAVADAADVDAAAVADSLDAVDVADVDVAAASVVSFPLLFLTYSIPAMILPH